MIVRPMVFSEWPQFRPWYTDRGEACPIDEIVPLKSGFVAETEKEQVGVGFLILTNTHMALMEHLQTNPRLPKSLQARALTQLVWHIEKIAYDLGFKVILGFVAEDHFSMLKFHEKQGAQRGSKLMRLVYKNFEEVKPKWAQ